MIPGKVHAVCLRQKESKTWLKTGSHQSNEKLVMIIEYSRKPLWFANLFFLMQMFSINSLN